MRKNLILLLISVIAPISMFGQNPFIRDQFSADPTARVFEGKVYVYPSHDIPVPADKPNLRQEWFCMADYHVFSSENLIDWTDHGVIVTQEKVPWVDSTSYTMWAPDCVYRNGKYYFYFPAQQQVKEMGFGTRIGVAIADKPYGPFTPQESYIQGVAGIDPCVLIDKDGQAYIYWAGMGLQAAKLKDNMLELDSQPIAVKGVPDGFKEGPFAFERNGKYYFTFPWVQDKTETLAYSMADNPLGPFEFKGIIMDQSPTECWTNHHSIIEYKGQWYLFYHHNDMSPKFDKNRSVRVDSLFFEADGTIRKVTPTLRGVGLTDAKREIQIDRYSSVSPYGTALAFLDPNNTFGGWKIVFLEKDAFANYTQVDFGSGGLKSVKVRAYSPDGGKIAIRTEGFSGTKIAEVTIPKSATWEEITVPLLEKPVGVQNLNVALESASTVNLDWISFLP